MFAVERAIRAGRDVAIKRYTGDTTGIAAAWTHSNVTNIFRTRQLGWPQRERPLDRLWFQRMLAAEVEVIARAAPFWNHPGAEWTPDGLVMPWVSGVALSELPRDEQRALFPRMVPPLWRALAACPHGDLAAEDLRIEGRLFHILDPGVSVAGPAYDGPLDFTSTLFTTNGASYPFLRPEHGPAAPRVTAGTSLAELVERERAVMWMQDTTAPPPPVADTPSAADVIAIGALYLGILAGTTLADVLGLGAPLWTGFWDDVGERPDRDPPCLARLEAGAVRDALAHAGATAAEIELCDRLVRLDVDTASIAGLAASAG